MKMSNFGDLFQSGMFVFRVGMEFWIRRAHVVLWQCHLSLRYMHKGCF